MSGDDWIISVGTGVPGQNTSPQSITNAGFAKYSDHSEEPTIADMRLISH
jgi:hypothetical protein